jgi:hypothetical protein
MTQLVQSQTGERLFRQEWPWETGTGAHERLLPQRVARFGDPDEGDGRAMTGASAEYISGLAQTMGLAPKRTADQARELGR